MSETPFESPADDIEVFDEDETVEPSQSLEVDEADAAEQTRVVPVREDDYR